MDFATRIEKTKNGVNKRLFHLMKSKKSNLCLALDLNSTVDILDLADKFGPHIIVLKLHVDLIEDFDYYKFIPNLLKLKEKHQFLIFEDRKFIDTDDTTARQYTGGIFRIQDWADLITVMANTGPITIEKLAKSVNNAEPRACLLVAQMSHKGNDVNGLEISRRIAHEYPDYVAGFISQSPLMENPEFVQFTPGVNIDVTGYGSGQQYVTPEEAVINRGADLIIVGRGVIKAEDPLANLLEFKQRGYKSYLEKVDQSSSK